MNELKFTDFVPSRAQSRDEKISVLKSGGFSFLSTFYRSKKIDNFQYVIIRYDKSNLAVGFYFTNNGSLPGVFKLFHKKNSAVTLSTSFWRDMGLTPENYAGKYSPQLFESDGKQTYYIVLQEVQHESTA